MGLVRTVTDQPAVASTNAVTYIQDPRIRSLQLRIANVVTSNLIDNGFWSGKTNNSADVEFHRDRILTRFEEFARSGTRDHVNWVFGTISNLSCYCPNVTMDDIKLYALFRGYKIEHTDVDANEKRYTRITGEYTREEVEELVRPYLDHS